MSTLILTGPNAHPFRCGATGCGNDYREHRFAARCCKVGSNDLRNGEYHVYSEEYEARKVKEDEVWRAELYAKCHYECSCGESFESVDAAVNCRKCWSYNKPAGYCTEVFDRDTGKVVWQSAAWKKECRREALAAERIAMAVHDSGSLKHNPFASLLG